MSARRRSALAARRCPQRAPAGRGFADAAAATASLLPRSPVFGALCRTVGPSAPCSKRFCFRAREQYFKSSLSVGNERWDCEAAVEPAALRHRSWRCI